MTTNDDGTGWDERQATEALRVSIEGGMIANIEQEGDRLSITTTDGGHFEVGIYAWTQPR